MKHPAKFFYRFSCVLTVFLAAVGAGMAQDVAPVSSESSVSLTQTQLENFPSALAALAAQGHVGFIVEGERPHEPRNTSSIAGLTQAQPLSSAVAKIAAAYDYDAHQQGSLYILKKRYTHPEDMPAITLEECVQAAGDLHTILSALSPDQTESSQERSGDWMADLAPSLTSSQLTGLQNSTLRMTDLNPDQQAMIGRALLALYVQSPAATASKLLARLRHAPRAAIRTRDDAGRPCLALEDKSSSRRSALILFDVSRPSGAAWSAAAPSSTETLSQAAAYLSALGQGVYSVEPELQNKPVMIFGAEAIPAAQTAAALTDLFGLELSVADNGSNLLARRPIRVPTEISALPDDLQRMLPDPLLRAIQSAAPTTPVSKGVDNSRADRLRQAATFALWMAVQDWQARNGASGGRIPVSALGDRAQRALAVILMTSVAEVIQAKLGPKMPDYLTKFDQLYLVGGPYIDPNEPNQPKFSLGIAEADVQSPEMRSLAGFEPIDYMPMSSFTAPSQ